MTEGNYSCQTAVVGGGAAGLMAAISAAMTYAGASENKADEHCSVILLEKSDRVGKKLLTTGNGRCNLSNRNMDADYYHGRDPSFAKRIIDRFTVDETFAFFRQSGLLCRTEKNGRIYPYSLQAAAVLDILRHTAERFGVRTVTSFEVTAIRPCDHNQDGFVVYSSGDVQVQARTIVVTTGGLAAPAFGCNGSGYALLKQFGHQSTDVFPALVQIKTDTDLVRGLAGLKFEGTASLLIDHHCVSTASGEILFAEYGLSGPPILDLSRRIGEALHHNPPRRVELSLDLLPDMDLQTVQSWLLDRKSIDSDLELADFLTGLVIKKIGQAVLKRSLEQQRSLSNLVSSLSERDLIRVANLLKALPIRVVGTRGWAQAQVTAGGLLTAEFDQHTLESRYKPGIYAAGEILDIDGDCGGYNLQWAWSSGHVAGRSAMQAALTAGDQP